MASGEEEHLETRDPGCLLNRLRKLKHETWRRYYDFEYLLTPDSFKIEKTNLAQRRWLQAVQFLAPATMAGGPNLCPHHTRGCYGERGENCIASTGRMNRDVLIARTKFFIERPRDYRERLFREIEHLRAGAKRCGRRLALRLNGTSDIAWERRLDLRDVFARFPDVQFFDYTKVPNRILRDGKRVRLPENYHLTFSRSEENDAVVAEIARKTRVNVAIVFTTKVGRGEHEPETLPRTWLDRRVIDGDAHDLRFLDPPEVVVGLRAKIGGLTKEIRVPGSAGSRFAVKPYLSVLP